MATSTPFKSAAPSYVKKGWDFVFPTVGGVPPKGVTGYQRSMPSLGGIEKWRGSRGGENIGIGMPDNVIAIDVDLKHDAEGNVVGDGWTPEIEDLLATLGLTWTNGHGDPGSPYRHYLYRVPEGVTADEVASIAGGLGPNVDLIKWNHRWLRVAPSIHKSGEVYEWYAPGSPDGPCKAPTPGMLPQLSADQWGAVRSFAGTVSSSGRYRPADVDFDSWIAEHNEPSASPRMKKAVAAHWSKAGFERHGSHHDAALAAAQQIAHLAEEGEAGAAKAMEWVGTRAVAYFDAEGREGQAEWDRIITSAIGKAVSKTESGDRGDDLPKVTTLSRGEVGLAPFVPSPSWVSSDPGRSSTGEGGTTTGTGSPTPGATDDGEFDEDWTPYSAPISSEYDFGREYLERKHPEGTLAWVEEKHWGVWDAERGHFRGASDEDVRVLVEGHLIGAEMATVKQRTVKGETVFEDLVLPVPRNTKSIAGLCRALADQTKVITYGESRLRPVRGFVPFRGMMVNTETGETLTPTPAYDLWWSLPGEYDPTPLRNEEIPNWSAFLDSLNWSEKQRRLAQQWYGYLISGATDQQLAMLLCGASRGGKGIMLKVAEALFEGSRTSLRNLNQLASEFGLESLPGRALCTVDDARFRRMEEDVVTALLSIIAEGTLTVNQKHKKAKDTVRVDARLMIATNETPRFNETTDALANRFLFLEFTESFKGREDFELLSRLLGEIPGIVKWALLGLEDLRETNRFVVTDEHAGIVTDVLEGSSQARRFVKDCGDVELGHVMSKADIFDIYRVWAMRKNEHPTTESVFFKMLHESFPGLKQVRVGGRENRVRSIEGLRVADVSTL